MSITLLSEYFDSWDPMQFIKDGAPKGEYSVEAADVVLKYQDTMSDADLAELVYKEFTESMEIDPDGFKDESLARASEIREAIKAS